MTLTQSSAIYATSYNRRARVLTITFRAKTGGPARTYTVRGISRRQADNIKTGRRHQGSAGRAYNAIVRTSRRYPVSATA
jgi:hypothetical protein